MTPREMWNTCCPDDPECEHSFLEPDELTRHMDTPRDDWYGTVDHRRHEEKIDEAREATWQDGYQEPPAGTCIPGLGEI